MHACGFFHDRDSDPTVSRGDSDLGSVRSGFSDGVGPGLRSRDAVSTGAATEIRESATGDGAGGETASTSSNQVRGS